MMYPVVFILLHKIKCMAEQGRWMYLRMVEAMKIIVISRCSIGEIL
jgi:hypothetical protein